MDWGEGWGGVKNNDRKAEETKGEINFAELESSGRKYRGGNDQEIRLGSALGGKKKKKKRRALDKE